MSALFQFFLSFMASVSWQMKTQDSVGCTLLEISFLKRKSPIFCSPALWLVSWFWWGKSCTYSSTASHWSSWIVWGISGEHLVTVTAVSCVPVFGFWWCFCVLLEEDVSRAAEPEFWWTPILQSPKHKSLLSMSVSLLFSFLGWSSKASILLQLCCFWNTESVPFTCVLFHRHFGHHFYFIDLTAVEAPFDFSRNKCLCFEGCNFSFNCLLKLVRQAEKGGGFAIPILLCRVSTTGRSFCDCGFINQ